MRTIAHTYATYSEATSVVNALESAGIPHSDISIVSGDNTAGTAETGTATGMTSGDPAQGASTGAGTGATLGTVLGGGAGLLAGLGSLAIPGVGPIVAAGWLVAALTGAGVGAAAGGLVGSLTGAGVSEADAQTYQSDVSSGRTLVTARVDESQAAHVEQLMGKTGSMTGSTTTIEPASHSGATSTGTISGGTTTAGTTTTGTTTGGTTVVGSSGPRTVGTSMADPVSETTPASPTTTDSTLRRDVETGSR
jgi:hypothetical protein